MDSVHRLLVQSPRVLGWVQDSYGNWQWKEPKGPEYNWDDNNYNPYVDNKPFRSKDIVEGFPEYNLNDLEGDYNPIDWAYYFDYILNLFFIVLPYVALSSAAIFYNLGFNVLWNDFWAQGNWWLVTNTLILMITLFVGLLEFLELPIWLHSFHGTRLVTGMFCILYNFIFFIMFLEWYDMLYIINDKSDYDFFTIYLNMFLAYNIAMNWPQTVVNFLILFKELSIEWFRFLNP